MKVLRFALPLLGLLACSDDAKTSAPPGTYTNTSSSSSSTGGGGSSSSASSSSGAPGNDGGPKADPFALRPYGRTVPAGYDAATPAPLVVLLHGYTSNAKDQDTYFGLSALAESKGFLVALPNGTKDTLGNPFWNATDACCNFTGSNVDDVAYLTAVIADMKARFSVDPKRVYLVGHSNGGFMSHRLACELSADIAGIVSLAGEQFADAAKCKATSPVAVLQVQGTADETVTYTGGSFPTGAYPGAVATVATWAAKNGCATELVPAETLDLESTLDGDETKVSRHSCTKGAAELWSITNGKHVPTFQPTWAAKLYAFLEAHPKP